MQRQGNARREFQLDWNSAHNGKGSHRRMIRADEYERRKQDNEALFDSVERGIEVPIAEWFR